MKKGSALIWGIIIGAIFLVLLITSQRDQENQSQNVATSTPGGVTVVNNNPGVSPWFYFWLWGNQGSTNNYYQSAPVQNTVAPISDRGSWGSEDTSSSWGDDSNSHESSWGSSDWGSSGSSGSWGSESSSGSWGGSSGGSSGSGSWGD